MNRRKFVFTSTILMVLIAGVVTGLALYSTYIVRASLPGLPEAVAYLPAGVARGFRDECPEICRLTHLREV